MLTWVLIVSYVYNYITFILFCSRDLRDNHIDVIEDGTFEGVASLLDL